MVSVIIVVYSTLKSSDFNKMDLKLQVYSSLSAEWSEKEEV